MGIRRTKAQRAAQDLVSAHTEKLGDLFDPTNSDHKLILTQNVLREIQTVAPHLDLWDAVNIMGVEDAGGVVDDEDDDEPAEDKTLTAA